MATTNKFGVPLTTGAGSAEGILMPKLKYRFRVTLSGMLNDERTTRLTQNVQSVTRPAVTYDEVVVDSYNSKVYMHGKHSWEPVTLVIRDDITNSVSKLVGNQVQRQVNHYQQTTPAAGNDYKFTTIIEILDGTSTTATETWELEGCFIQNVNYSDTDYSASTDPVTITLQIRYDNALHLDSLFDEGVNPPGGSIRA